MNKADQEKARQQLLRKIKRELKKGTKARKIADSTGYTPQRIYQIRDEMQAAGELPR